MNTPSRGLDKKRSRLAGQEKPAWRDQLQQFYKAWNPYLTYYGVLAASMFLIYLLIRPPAEEDLSKFRLEQPSPKLIVAPFDFEFVDEITTQARKDEAEALVSPVYNHVPENLEKTLQAIRDLSQAARSTVNDASQSVEDWSFAVLTQTGLKLEDRTVDVPPNAPESFPRSTFEALLHYSNSNQFWSSILSHIQTASGRLGIADNVTPLRQEPNLANINQKLAQGVAIASANGERVATALYEIHSYPEFLQRFREGMETSFPNKTEDSAAIELALDLVQAVYAGPTLVYNTQLTERRREEASSYIQPIVVQVKKGETLVGRNELVKPENIQKLKALQELMRVSPIAEVGYFVFGILFTALVVKYLKSYYPDIASDTKKIAVIFLAMLMLLAITRIAAYLSLLDYGANTLKPVAYAVPMGALGVILTILSSPRLALVCCGITSIYADIVLHGYLGINTLPYLMVSVMTSYGAIFTVTRIRRRSDLYRAGGMAIFLASLVILAVSLQQYTNFEDLLLRADELKWSLIWGAVNGALVSILSIALMPIFEDFYGKITDIKLLELSQKNELIQRLEQEAPGSYQHSMRVATLAETAAEAIGANALLVRVGTLYHDIGKIVKPLYFVENQQTPADKAKHSKISPNMSCLIIRNHVKHGLELAEKYGLPKAITDFIPEHHGTTLMTYFYHQALNSQETEGTVKEEDFRYSGPKPQSKETAILMLADALEASSRVLENPTERDVRQLVRKIINERFMDGQFDECNITMKDLHTLYQSFSETLIDAMHKRIAYPTLVRDRGEDGARAAEIAEPTISNAAIREKERRDGGERAVRVKENGNKDNGASAKPAVMDQDEAGARVEE